MDHPLQICIVWYMQICMKATEKELEALRGQIAKARADSSLSDAEIAQISRVHPSQVSRICRGSFRTISNNVVQICNVLEVPMQRSEEHTSELQSLMRISYAVFCLKKKNRHNNTNTKS